MLLMCLLAGKSALQGLPYAGENLSQKMLSEKGSVSPAIIWLGVIVAVLIVVVWYVTSVSPQSQGVQIVSNDLTNLQELLNDMCNSATYSSTYNPFLEDGNLLVSGYDICMSSKEIKKCRKLACDTQIQAYIDLRKVVELKITKEQGGKGSVKAEQLGQ